MALGGRYKTMFELQAKRFEATMDEEGVVVRCPLTRQPTRPRAGRHSPDATSCRQHSSSMWRLCKLGYTHEPRLVVVVVTLTLLQAVPDALFALWLKLMADALLAGNCRLLFATLGGDGGLGDSDLAAPGGRHAADPTVPRPGHDRARDPRRHTPGVGLGAGAPGATGLSRPAGGAPQPGLRAGPHVRVAAGHDRLDRPRRRSRSCC